MDTDNGIERWPRSMVGPTAELIRSPRAEQHRDGVLGTGDFGRLGDALEDRAPVRQTCQRVVRRQACGLAQLELELVHRTGQLFCGQRHHVARVLGHLVQLSSFHTTPSAGWAQR